jgi:signal transduction histidine kinase
LIASTSARVKTSIRIDAPGLPSAAPEGARPGPRACRGALIFGRFPRPGLRSVRPPEVSPDVTPDAAFRAYLTRERTRWIAHDALVRMVGSAGFLAAAAMLWLVTARQDWFVYLLPLGAHLAASLFAWALRGHRLHHRVGVVMALADVGLVFAVQRLSMPESPFPAGVAGFSLGLFAMVIVLDAELLPRAWVFFLAAEAYIFQATLMHVAGVSGGAIGVAALVLGMVAWTARTARERMEALMREQVEAELARVREVARAVELEEARATIERLLEAERGQNERLLSLQREKDQLSQLLVHDLRSPTGMIHGILDVGRMEEGRLVLRREPLRVVELIDDVVRGARPLAAKQNIHLLIEADVDLRLDADRDLLRRLLENLVSNALRYTPRHRRVCVAAQREGGELVIRVHNEGRPIEPAKRSTLFQKFGQLEGAKVGWGLGLYFCRLATEAHGGSITLEDTPGWDVTFTFRLPLTPTPVLQSPPAHAALV